MDWGFEGLQCQRALDSNPNSDYNWLKKIFGKPVYQERQQARQSKRDKEMLVLWV
jgi:hypothetical protein